MRNKLVAVSFILGILTLAAILVNGKNQTPNLYYPPDINSVPVENMPIISDDPFAAYACGNVPIEQRDPQLRKWLAVSLMIRVPNASGSGTIIYHDQKSGYSYVQSCGHLWQGNMTAQEGERRKVTCTVVTWYHNSTKLDKPKNYTAEVLYFSNSRGRDVSLLRFQPDWVPEYIPIAPEDFQYQTNERLHSCGCDGGSEVAHYSVRYLGLRNVGDGWMDLVTTENSPRPGRSGGGLMNEMFYVGICWGTTDRAGNGNGLFTPLATVRQYNKHNGYGWLNDIGESLARMIPIKDRNNPQGNYPKNYIPLPEKLY